MIRPFEDKEGCKQLWQDWIGLHVFYQQPHMTSPEYGVITSIHSMPVLVHIRFNGESTSKACRPEDLHWPPDFCAQDRVNPPGQPFTARASDE